MLEIDNNNVLLASLKKYVCFDVSVTFLLHENISFS